MTGTKILFVVFHVGDEQNFRAERQKDCRQKTAHEKCRQRIYHKLKDASREQSFSLFIFVGMRVIRCSAPYNTRSSGNKKTNRSGCGKYCGRSELCRAGERFDKTQNDFLPERRLAQDNSGSDGSAPLRKPMRRAARKPF